MAKKKASARSTKRVAKKRPSAKRDLVRRKTGSAYAKRSAGKFKEMDDVGRSQKADRRTKAKRTVKSGYGDQGDQKGTVRKKRSGPKRSR
jgi:hypothetical protein